MSSERAVRAVLKVAAKQSVKDGGAYSGVIAHAIAQAQRFQYTVRAMNVLLQKGTPIPLSELQHLASSVAAWANQLEQKFGNLYGRTSGVAESLIEADGLREGTALLVKDTQRLAGDPEALLKRQKVRMSTQQDFVDGFLQNIARTKRELEGM